MESRLGSAKRRNQRRLALPTFCSGVRGAMGSGFDIEERLLDLEESAEFSDAFQRKLQELQWARSLESTRTKHHDRFQEEVSRAFSLSRGREFLTILGNWERVGAFRVSGKELESGLLPLLAFDGDTVYGGTRELDSLFLFDMTRNLEVIYEALHWWSGNAST